MFARDPTARVEWANPGVQRNWCRAAIQETGPTCNWWPVTASKLRSCESAKRIDPIPRAIVSSGRTPLWASKLTASLHRCSHALVQRVHWAGSKPRSVTNWSDEWERLGTVREETTRINVPLQTEARAEAHGKIVFGQDGGNPGIGSRRASWPMARQGLRRSLANGLPVAGSR